ncbi:uncharacterized protein LOC123673372 [Harmonia axyridis]|uniref:uncharacterized protein LOC123673372 n=1 Tax=Harmonia axyridis TaxID=115357 RepID=UPI001E278597|nr:uncharacterized protein LOC123673372 [Harmonia axyridis]
MTSINELRFKRGLSKGALTRFQNFVDKIQLDSLDVKIVEQLKARLSMLENTYCEFSKYQDLIEYHLQVDEAQDVEAVSREQDERELFENNYFNLLSFVKSTIIQFEDTNDSVNNVGNTRMPSNDESISSAYSDKQLAKLPALVLPQFSGSVENWLEFRDIFNSLIENNRSLDDVQKFYYLKSCLKGEASHIIESIAITKDNYKIAFNLLKERYENKKLIVERYINILLHASPIQKENSTELRKLHDSFISTLRSLKGLGQPTEHWDTFMVYLLVSKFDSRTRRDWENLKIQGELPTLKEISSFLKEKCDILEKYSKSDKHFENTYKNDASKSKRVNAFVANGFACYLCNGNHSIFKCDKFLRLNVHERMNEIQKMNRCVNCFGKHSLKECKRSTCKICHRFHNTLLHRSNSERSDKGETGASVTANATVCNDTSSVASSNSAIVHRAVETTDPANCLNISSNAATAGGTMSILSTAKVEINNRQGGEWKLPTCKPNRDTSSYLCINSRVDEDSVLNDNLRKFWQIDESLEPAIKNEFCEKHFVESYSRQRDGRFKVKIPFKENIKKLGKSKQMALKRFEGLEKRLKQNQHLREHYNKFMQEYLTLGHLKPVEGEINDLADDGTVYYVPHHAIFKNSTTTPCRVVFDFSAKTDSDISLNDAQGNAFIRNECRHWEDVQANLDTP